MTDTSSVAQIGTVLIFNCNGSKMPGDFGGAAIRAAADKLGLPIDAGGALSYHPVDLERESLAENIRVDLERMAAHPDPTVIVIGDVDEQEWQDLLNEFTGPEFVRLSSAEFVA